MEIRETKIKVKDLFKGYIDNGEEGVVAYSGKLDVRPAYQREFVYKPEQEKAVIDTVLKGFPLNIMYWCQTGKNKYEILDGQQRTLSLMHFLDHKFCIIENGNSVYVDTLTNDKYEKLENYELSIYICEGSESEKLEWFRTVNIAGEELTEQELRNSVYTGEWLTDAKKHFSKRECVAKKLGDKFIKGDPNRQEILEKVLKGMCDKLGLKDIDEYMAKHRNNKDAEELWQYYQDVINWINKVFKTYRKEMLGLDWFRMYNTYGDRNYNSNDIDKKINDLMVNEDIESKKGIYEYVLDNDNPFRDKYLNLRAFLEKDKRTVYEKQKGICPICKKHFEIEEMEGDHIKPFSQGGGTTIENLQMLCKSCNRQKSGK